MVEEKAIELLQEKQHITYEDLLPIFPDYKPDTIRVSLSASPRLHKIKLYQRGRNKKFAYTLQQEEDYKMDDVINTPYFPYPEWMMPSAKWESGYNECGVKEIKFRSRKGLNN